MGRIKLSALFFGCLFLTWMFSLKIAFFPSFLVFSYYHTTRNGSLWWACLAGLALDFIDYDTRFGLNSLTYCLTTFFLYDKKRHFFYDYLSTFPLMTFLFSFLSTTVHFTFLSLFGREMAVSFPLFFYDFLLLPLIDALFAFFAYTLPLLFFGPTRRKGRDYFF